jgi:CRP-like cAMP-binding protein
MEHLALTAFFFGILSASSLPMGAITSIFWSPRERVVAVMMAFGAGALLAALTIDLVGNALSEGHFYSLAAGCIIGGILFDILNFTINSKGGFLRKTATTINHLKQRKVKHYRYLVDKMSRVHLFNLLPPEEIQDLVPEITTRTYKKGAVILHQGDIGDSLFIIDRGTVEIYGRETEINKIASLGENDVVGEIALVTGEPRTATAIAATEVRVLIILKESFDRLLSVSPKLDNAVMKLVRSRIGDLREKQAISRDQAKKWLHKAAQNIDSKAAPPTDMDIREAASEHGGAPVAIWLGILLDGIPESLVIGASLIHESVSISLLAGLFLSNFPEALSSSIGMRRHNFPTGKIIWMWTSLMIFTGIGAFFGNIYFDGVPDFLFALTEGVAAGAMLTMIAETMLPEAYFKGGAISGFSTLLGFLAAIFFKTFE